MVAVANILEQAFIERVLSSKSPLTHRTKSGLVLFALAGLLAMAGVGFILYALFLWLQLNYAPHISYAMLGSIILMLSVSFIGFSIFLLKYKQRKITQFKTEILEELKDMSGLVGDDVSALIADNPKTSMLLASTLGFTAAEKLL